MATSRGVTSAISVTATGATWQSIFDRSTDGSLTGFGIETASGNSARVNVRWTVGQASTDYNSTTDRVNYASVAADSFKIFKAQRNQIKLIEVQAASGTQSIYFDVLDDENIPQ